MQAALYHCAIAFALLQVHYISSYHLFGYARAVAGVIPSNKFRGGHRYGLQSTQVPLNDDVPLAASDAADDDYYYNHEGDDDDYYAGDEGDDDY